MRIISLCEAINYVKQPAPDTATSAVAVLALHIIPKPYERSSSHLRIPGFSHFGWPFAGVFAFGG